MDSTNNLKALVRPRRLVAGFLPVLLLVLGTALARTARAQSATTVMVGQNASLGSILTDSGGMTLYTFGKDTPGMSNCSGQCAVIWPPFQAPAGALSLPDGVGGMLATITRSDGTQQVTYNGMPLYFFARDMNPGDATGQGVGGFAVATPQAAASATAPAMATNTGVTVQYAAGFNLVGVPSGTQLTGTDGPMFTFQAGDTSYETVPAGAVLQNGAGYWAFFTTPVSLTLPAASSQGVTVQAPAGQYILIGNPTDAPATVSGADAVFSYTPGSGYQATTTLAPGQGAWALSQAGGTIQIGAPAASATAASASMPDPAMMPAPLPAAAVTGTMPAQMPAMNSQPAGMAPAMIMPAMMQPAYQSPVMLPNQAPAPVPGPYGMPGPANPY